MKKLFYCIQQPRWISRKVRTLLGILVLCTACLSACGREKHVISTETTLPAESPLQTEGSKQPEASTESEVSTVTEPLLHLAYVSGVEEFPTDSAWIVSQAVEGWCEENNVRYTMYMDEHCSNGGKIPSVEAALKDDVDVILYFGNAFIDDLCDTARINSDTFFIALGCIESDYMDYSTGEPLPIPENVCFCDCQGELAHYLSGYASVRLGFRQIGMVSPYYISFYMPYLMGADRAAQETGVSVHIQDVSNGGYFCTCGVLEKEHPGIGKQWCQEGVDLIYANGTHYLAEMVYEDIAASNTQFMYYDVIPLQADAAYYDQCAASWVIQHGAAAEWMLDELILRNGWETYGGTANILGIVDPERPFENPVTLSELSKWNESFTVEDYKELLRRIHSGEIEVIQPSLENPYEPTYVSYEYLGNVTMEE